MVPLFAEGTLIPSSVGVSSRRWREVLARLIIQPVSAMIQLSLLSRSCKELWLDNGDELGLNFFQSLMT